MKFTDFVTREAVKANLQADLKPDVIRELVQSLSDAGRLASDQLDSIVKAIMKREELGSTGIGRGVAVPHTKHPSVSRLTGAVAVSAEGVDFQSLDGEKVHLFFLLVSPPRAGVRIAQVAQRKFLPVPQAGSIDRRHLVVARRSGQRPVQYLGFDLSGRALPPGTPGNRHTGLPFRNIRGSVQAS
jgi:mannitol/fructose-specific phosphotransferase system IIA component (Ntr-type)